jgi:hypothetical protein
MVVTLEGREGYEVIAVRSVRKLGLHLRFAAPQHERADALVQNR